MRRSMRRRMVLSRYVLKSTPKTLRSTTKILVIESACSASAWGLTASVPMSSPTRYGCLPRRASSAAMPAGSRTMSTALALMAEEGMPP